MSENAKHFIAGKKLATPQNGEDIVITGMSGNFPNSDNVTDFKANLLNKVDLCDDDTRRWLHTHPEIPKLAGKINDVKHFDAGFFGVHAFQANFMDPMLRLLLERTIEAIMDAGMNPLDLKGSNTGVFIGTCYAEQEKVSYFEYAGRRRMSALTGCLRPMLAYRIAYFLQLNGPALILDTACSSGMFALEVAYRAIREGKCEQAIVAGSNLCFHRNTTLQFARLGVLNMNTGCRPFDKDAAGYTRSEAIAVLLLQKSKDAKRIYAKIIHSKTNSDGFKEQGITFPSSEAQINLMQDTYKECNISPKQLAFLEAHGTGTKVGDPEELIALDKFCFPERTETLYIGSVKGNIGHSEPTSGICSIIKTIYGMECNLIPPNIHYDNPLTEIESIEQKRLEVITEPLEWPKYSDIAGVNCFGFGGSNAHVILERNKKKFNLKTDNQPRIVCVSGRTPTAIQNMQELLIEHKNNYEVIQLVQDIYNKTIPNHIYRGFVILSGNEAIKTSCNYFVEEKKLCLCLGSDYLISKNDFDNFCHISHFQDVFKRIKKVAQENNLQINLNNFQSKLNQKLLTCIAQIYLVSILKELQIDFNFIQSYSQTDFIAAYASDLINLEESFLLTYCANICNTNANSNVIKKMIKNIPNFSNKIQKPETNHNEYGTFDYFMQNIENPPTYPKLHRNIVIIGMFYEVKSSFRNMFIDMTKQFNEIDFLVNLGRLYEVGENPNVSKLYPRLEWPVSRGTPMLSSTMKWIHKREYLTPDNVAIRTSFRSGERPHDMYISNTEYFFYKGHVIDGRNLFPAIGYLYNIWLFYADILATPYQDMKISFENVAFHRATAFGKNNSITLYMGINCAGYFEIDDEHMSILVSGHVRLYKNEINNEVVYTSEEHKLVKKDVYKKMRLRGYNYKGAFQLIEECNGSGALVNWNDNWITFMDNMLQLSILSQESNALYVPTFIDQVIIDAKAHLEFVKTLGEEKHIPVSVEKETQIIKTQFIEFRGLKASAIPRRRQTALPILESYHFVPNHFETTINESIRINMQLLLENKVYKLLKVLEIYDDSNNLEPISLLINQALRDLPVIQSEISLYTNKTLEIEDANINMINLEEFQTKKELHANHLYVSCNILREEEKLQTALNTLHADGFLLSVESDNAIDNIDSLNILTKHQIGNKFIYFARKMIEKSSPILIDVSKLDDLHNWLPRIQENIKTNDNIIVYAQNDALNGILGLINCLRREPKGENVRCLFIQDENQNFDSENDFYKQQFDKNLAVNVLNGNVWGTYRHTLLKPAKMSKVIHWKGDIKTKGDFSTLNWAQNTDYIDKNDMIHVHYSALNFRDIMITSGKLSEDAINIDNKSFKTLIGIEFSGVKANGERVMGICNGGSLGNIMCVKQQNVTCFAVPKRWSLEDAATVPVVYSTVLYALTNRCDLKKYKTILIHSGTGGVGQAAINLCLYYKLKIFVTVGSEEKKTFLLENFPQLNAHCISNSHSTDFEQMIMKETNHKGVDIVLNSLSEEKLQASVRCLAKGGTFIEIGKYDLSKNSLLLLDLITKNCSYEGIMLDTILNMKSEVFMDYLSKLLMHGIENDYVKPLVRMIYKKDQLEEAFRSMTTGKHKGKVLIQIKDDVEEMDKFNVKFYGNPKASYIILGGLGGFGLELANWLIQRGAKTIILSSRNGAQSGYQHLKLKYWQSLNANVIISREDITTYEGCEKLIREAENEAPIEAIFNLAVVLKDALFENQNAETFETSIKPKALATQYFDELTRKMCKQLKHFVVFSSVSCGRGNPGQTNYGLSNSIMERVCEKRRRDGLPALAIQWGAVGDVGLVAELQKDHTEIAIGGTLQQRITSCLDMLDDFLMQDETIVSSMVVAEKTGMSSGNLLQAVMSIMSIKDLKSISMHASLPELGMDSMMGVEIKQMLETDYDIFLTPQDMRTLTFAKLVELNNSSTNLSQHEANEDTFKLLLQKQKVVFNTENALIKVGSELKNKERIITFFPGIDCNFGHLQDHCKLIMNCVHYPHINFEHTDINTIIDTFLPHIKSIYKTTNSFNIVAHSYGSVIAIAIAEKLESEGMFGKLVFIDGSPHLMSEFFNIYSNRSEVETEGALISALMGLFMPIEKLYAIKDNIIKAKNFEERIKLAADHLPDNLDIPKEELIKSGLQLYYRMNFLKRYKVTVDTKLKSSLLLCKPKQVSMKNLAEDYKLSDYFENPIEIAQFDGNHHTILENQEMWDSIEHYFN